MTAGSASDGDGWAVDEVGIAFGIVGDLRLKTLYQPVFKRRGDALVPVAVSASFRFERHGRPLDGVAGLSPEQVRLAKRLSVELALRNHGNVGCETPDLDLIVAPDFTAGVRDGDIERLSALADSVGVERRRLVVDLSGIGASFRGQFARAVGGDICVALDLAATSTPTADAAGIWPAILRMPPLWTRPVLMAPTLAGLVAPLAAAVARRGGSFQVEGIDSAVLLGRALAAGAERLQGEVLAPAALAGTEFDDRPRPIRDLIGRGAVSLIA